MAQLIVNVPGTVEGELIEIPPFGLVENGTTTELTVEQEEDYELYMQYLSHDEDYEWDGEDILIPTPTPEVTPVEAPPEPGPVLTEPEPESEDGE